jgi:hypothetical protein
MNRPDFQCDHWNTMLPGGIPLNPLRCRREQGHPGRHACGDTAWSEDLGRRVAPSLVLPPNPFGTAATWADYDWRQIADDVRHGRSSEVAGKVLDLVADALGEPA